MSISIALTSLSPIANYDDLQSEIAEWLNRTGDTATEDRIPSFIQMTEEYLERELRCPEMERTITFSASDEDTPLPSDYLAMRSIYIEDSPDRPLRGMAPTAQRIDFTGATGTPQAYILVSGALRLAPPPADETLLTMDYFARLDRLSVMAPTNWVLEKHSGAYVAGALYHAYWFLDNKEEAGACKAVFDELIRKINRTATNDRYGAGPLVPNGVRQVWGSKC